MRLGILGSGLMGGIGVVSAFNTVPSEVLFGLYEARRSDRPLYGALRAPRGSTRLRGEGGRELAYRFERFTE